MRVLFDHNVTHKLRRSLIGHEDKTADEMSWTRLTNGDLLDAADLASFDVMITGDKNLPFLQNLTNRKLALIIRSTNDWNEIKLNLGTIVAAVDIASPGTCEMVAISMR